MNFILPIKILTTTIITVLLLVIWFEAEPPISYIGGIGGLMLGWYIAGYYDMKERLGE